MAMLIGLSGLAGSGKSTVARQLVESHGFGLYQGVRQIGFADPLKEAAAIFAAPYGFSSDFRSWRQADKDTQLGELIRPDDAPLTLRYLLQTLGTEWGRHLLHESFWVDHGLRRAQEALSKGYELVLFDDCRFVNEAVAIRKRGGEVWFIDRPSVTEAAMGKDLHASEAEQLSSEFQDLVDVTLVNESSMTHLADQIAKAIERLRAAQRRPQRPQKKRKAS